MKMKVYAALREDINVGWIWLSNPAFPQRSVVKITNPAQDKSVYCEALQIDDNFLAHYNQSRRFTISERASTLVINEWYRSRLGCLNTGTDYDLRVELANDVWGRFLACIQHPQVVVRLATWLAAIGLALAIIGTVLGIAALWPRP